MYFLKTKDGIQSWFDQRTEFSSVFLYFIFENLSEYVVDVALVSSQVLHWTTFYSSEEHYCALLFPAKKTFWGKGVWIRDDVNK